MRPLTRRQAEILAFIEERIATGLPPTMREVAAQFGFTSANGVNDHYMCLARKGRIETGHRGTNAARDIRVLIPLTADERSNFGLSMYSAYICPACGSLKKETAA